jgi:hypothetical protein
MKSIKNKSAVIRKDPRHPRSINGTRINADVADLRGFS